MRSYCGRLSKTFEGALFPSATADAPNGFSLFALQGFTQLMHEQTAKQADACRRRTLFALFFFTAGEE